MHNDNEKSSDNIMMRAQSYLDDYINFLERLNFRSVRLIEKCTEINLSYKDIYDNAHGHDEVEEIFKNRLDKFEIYKYSISEKNWANDNIIYLDGNIIYSRKKSIPVIIKLTISQSGKILSHCEYINEPFFEEKPKTIIQRLFARG